MEATFSSFAMQFEQEDSGGIDNRESGGGGCLGGDEGSFAVLGEKDDMEKVEVAGDVVAVGRCIKDGDAMADLFVKEGEAVVLDLVNEDAAGDTLATLGE